MEEKELKTTKRALFSSVVALILCFSMLVGTTFAWFTDEVTSANNVIVAGNLDIVLEYWDGDSWEDVQGKSDILTNSLWEPGVTEVAYLRVAYAGSLALKYQLGINIVSETEGTRVNKETGDDEQFKLSDYIQFGVVEGIAVDATTKAPAIYATREAAVAAVAVAKKLNEGYTKASSMISAQELYLALVVWMPTTIGNEANYKTGTEAPEINLGIKVAATQVTNESDSFGSDYDDGAFIPVAPESVPEEGGVVVNGSAESGVTVDVPAAVVNNLPDDVTSLAVNASAPVVDTTNKTVSFSTVELVDQNGKEVDLSNSTAKVTVTLPVGGAFADGEEIEVYHDGSFVAYATVADGKISYEVSHFCEVTVKVAEEVVLDNTIDSVKEFMAFAAAVNAGNSYAGQTVVLGADLDLAGVTWSPIGTSANPFKGTFDGNGKVIKNLSVLMAGQSNVGLFGYTTDGEIKNVIVENAKVAGRLNVGVVAGTPYTSKYTNITVKGHVEVDGMAYVGTVGGKNAYADWNNITVDVDANSYVNANSVENGTAYRTYVGGVVGFNGEGGHTFKNITSNINVIGSTCDVGGAFGIAHYGNKFENVTVTGTVTCTEETTEIGAIAGVWHNGGENVVFTNCTATLDGEAANVASFVGGSKLAQNTVVVNGVEVVTSVEALQAKLNAATAETTINLGCDITGDVTVTQKPDVKITIDGKDHKFNGVITVDGKSSRYATAALTIKNVNFDGKTCPDAKVYPDAYIRLGHVDAARYTNNVTVQNCTFNCTDKSMVGVKSYTGGDWNVTLDNLTVNAGMHSLAQLKNVEKNLVVTNCVVNSKNGLNINNGTNLTMDGCTFNVQGYAVRFGESANTTDETFNITNSTLKSACAESGDAVIEFRKGAVNATLNLTKTTLEGTVTFKGNDETTKITIDGVKYVVATTLAKVMAAAKEGNVIIDAKGANLGDYNYDGTFGNGTVLKNAKFTYIYGASIDGVVTFENCEFVSDHSYSANFSDGSTTGEVIFNNCYFDGWNSFGTIVTNVKMNNCTFDWNNPYSMLRFYQNAQLNNCEFINIDGIDNGEVAGTTVTLNNCTGIEGKIHNNTVKGTVMVSTWVVDGVVLTDVSAW